MRRLLIGAAGGFALGYAVLRAAQGLGDLRARYGTLPADPKAYGRLRRRLLVSGIARSLAELGAASYGPATGLAPRNGVPERRSRRLALLSAALAASAVLDLPAAYVESHVLERRYGLTRQSASDWAVEQAKAFGVTSALALPLLEALASAIERAPRAWPLLATSATLPLLVIANLVAPNFIAPLFNKFEPLEGPLEPRLRALAAAYGAGDAAILRVDMSRQTEKANAYVTGLFGSKRIVVGDTLLRDFDEEAIVFVVAHELGHYVSRDVWRSVGVGSVAAAAVFFGARAIVAQDSVPAASAVGLGRTFFAASLIALVIGPALAAFSRSRERAADRFALAATGDPGAGIRAFRRLREKNLAEDEQPLWMELLFSSHPSLRSRIAALEASSGPG